MSKAILIQCTKSKRDEAALATNLYDESTLFNKMKEYAKATGCDWYILSAKHGLVQPSEWIEPYDEFGLTEPQAYFIAEGIKVKGYDEVELIAGDEYTFHLTPELEAHAIDVMELCQGLSIGKRMAKLDELISEESNHNLC